MIERLRIILQTLEMCDVFEPSRPDVRRMLDDCADALRLELDCPQQSLLPGERAALLHLHDLIDSPGAAARDIAVAVRGAARALHLSANEATPS